MRRRLAKWMLRKAVEWNPEHWGLIYDGIRQHVIKEIAASEVLAAHQRATAARAARQ